ncbi:MAG: lipopolysaccharide heptosyltransferase I [Neisseriaceae bacterium]
MKILLVRTSSMGDLVHTLYAVEDLATHRPEIELHWFCEGAFADIPKLHPFVKKVIPFPWRTYRKHLIFPSTWKKLVQKSRELANEQYDLVIDSQGLLKSAYFARWARAPVHGFAKDSIREKLACFFYQNQYSIPNKDNVIWKNRQLFSKIFQYEPFIHREEYGVNLSVPAMLPMGNLEKDRFHVVITGASKDEKLWKDDHWRKLLKLRHAEDHLPVWLVWGSEEEYRRSKRIARSLDFVGVCPKMPLEQVASLLDWSHSVVSLDTGLLHLANALNKPTVGIYLNSSTQNTRVENREWEVVVGGINTQVSVSEAFENWNKVLFAYKKLQKGNKEA